MIVKILVAAHKDYFMPHDMLYLPVQVGSALAKEDLGWQRDDEGENISAKNPHFCELTGLYWAWKNLKADYLGLVHYRRHFSYKRKGNSWSSVLTTEEAEYLLQHNDIILPTTRRYWIETLRSHYKHTHDVGHLDLMRQIIAETSPDYLKAYDKVMRSTGGHMFNMFIMKRSLADSYCEWLFGLLGELEKRIDLQGMNAFDERLFGRVSEFLLDTWIIRNGYKYKEIGFVQIGPYNFWRKAYNFLMAKLLNKKYTASC